MTPDDAKSNPTEVRQIRQALGPLAYMSPEEQRVGLQVISRTRGWRVANRLEGLLNRLRVLEGPPPPPPPPPAPTPERGRRHEQAKPRLTDEQLARRCASAVKGFTRSVTVEDVMRRAKLSQSQAHRGLRLAAQLGLIDERSTHKKRIWAAA